MDEPSTLSPQDRALLRLIEADLDSGGMVELLNGIPGALERAQVGRTQAREGDTIALDDLQ